MSDAQIPVALDPDGHPVHIDDAPRHRTNYYRCPECGDFVNPRKGDVRTHHFSHAPGTLQEHRCSLGTQSDVERLMDEYRTSEAEKAEQAKNVRVFLGRSYGSIVKAFGILPPLDWSDVDDPSDLSEDIKKVTIETEGIKTSPKPEWFHPSEAEVRIDLDPEAGGYRVSIEAGDSLDALDGVWESSGPSEGDTFVGTPERARRVDVGSTNEPAVKPHDWVYVLQSDKPSDLPGVIEAYDVGPWVALGFEVTSDTEKYLKEYVGIEKADKSPFYADIVLPAWADPGTSSPVQGPPGSEALIAVIPPPEADPDFEVVSVPRDLEQMTHLPKTGAGEPRYVRPTFPTRGSKRILVHWAARQRLVHLHTAEDPTNGAHDLKRGPSIGIRVDTIEGESVLLNPLTGPRRATVDASEDAPPIKTCLDFAGPEGYELDFRMEMLGQDDDSDSLERHGVTFQEALSEISYYVSEDSDGIEFSFDALGAVKVEFGGSRPWMEDISDAEIRRRLQEMDELPKKARWPLVREIMGAPPGTPHEEFPSTIKKRVRRAFMEERRERRDDD